MLSYYIPVSHYVGAIDQGTTSTRFAIFDADGHIVACAQKEHQQIYPRPGWVEHDADEIWTCTQTVIQDALDHSGVRAQDIAAIGITNQRETTLAWNRKTGRPVAHAIVWQDTRVSDYVSQFTTGGGQDRFRATTGLPLSTYFSSLKIRWILDNVAGLRSQAEAGEILFGNIDAYLVWNLTGGPDGGLHVTDVTNASRTQLMNLETLAWDPDLSARHIIDDAYAANPFVNDAPPPQGTVPLGQFACPLVSRVEGGAGRSAVRTMWYPGGAVAAAAAGAAVPATSPATPGITTRAPVTILRMCMSVLW